MAKKIIITEQQARSIVGGPIEVSPFSSVVNELMTAGVSVNNAALMHEYGLQRVTLTKKGDVVTLNIVVVSNRNQGNGTRFMEDLTDIADKHGWTLALTPDETFGATSINRLKNFYKRFGFKDNKGRNTDFTISSSMIRPRKSTLYETVNELDLYHGTHADFDHFSEDFYLTGIGEMAYGWGVYLTNSINTAKEYSPGGQIMTVEVPDGKYLNSERIGKDEASKLARAFYRFYLNGKGAEIYKGSEQEFWDYECKYLETVPDGSYMYGTVSTFLGSDKEASEWFHSMGYAGLKFPGHNANTGEKFMNYVIFDANDVKIINKTSTNTL